MHHSSFYYTASFSSEYFLQSCGTEDTRDIPTPPMLFGLPIANPTYFYTSVAPNYCQIPAPMLAPFPDHPVPCSVLGPVPDYNPSFSTDISDISTSAASYYSCDMSSTSALSQPITNDSLLEHSLTNFYSGDDVVSVTSGTSSSSEVSQRFAGTFAPSFRGASPVILYRIPCTDLCYVYNRVRSTDGSKRHYVCRECYLKKKFVAAKVVNQCYFITDPLAGGHICRPKSYAKEITSRNSAKRRLNGRADDSGLSNSFSGIN